MFLGTAIVLWGETSRVQTTVWRDWWCPAGGCAEKQTSVGHVQPRLLGCTPHRVANTDMCSAAATAVTILLHPEVLFGTGNLGGSGAQGVVAGVPAGIVPSPRLPPTPSLQQLPLSGRSLLPFPRRLPWIHWLYLVCQILNVLVLACHYEICKRRPHPQSIISVLWL